jgi:hypothetical protein
MRLLLVITLRATQRKVIRSQSDASVQHRSRQAGRWEVVVTLLPVSQLFLFKGLTGKNHASSDAIVPCHTPPILKGRGDWPGFGRATPSCHLAGFRCELSRGA